MIVSSEGLMCHTRSLSTVSCRTGAPSLDIAGVDHCCAHVHVVFRMCSARWLSPGWLHTIWLETQGAAYQLLHGAADEGLATSAEHDEPDPAQHMTGFLPHIHLDSQFR